MGENRRGGGLGEETTAATSAPPPMAGKHAITLEGLNVSYAELAGIWRWRIQAKMRDVRLPWFHIADREDKATMMRYE